MNKVNRGQNDRGDTGGQSIGHRREGGCRGGVGVTPEQFLEGGERRITGLQTIEEFMARRLSPAMATCASLSSRLQELSERVARASSLLSTRVSIAREKQNQALLASMDRRARLQLRLQQTVEGLSVVAISYYVVGLIDYAAKGLEAAGTGIDSAIVSGVAIPLVAFAVAMSVRWVRRRVVGIAPQRNLPTAIGD